MKKYYILKRVSKDIINDYLCEFSKTDREKIEKRIDANLPLLLVEKTIKNLTESYTNMWTIGEGCESLWTVHTKENLMYDYTGVVYPLIHENGTVLTWTQYTNKQKLLC